MKKIIALSTIIITIPSYAMFCPKNYNQINIGDSIELVTAQCGTPDLQKDTKEDTNAPQEWVYYAQVTAQAETRVPIVAQQTSNPISSSIKFFVGFGADKRVVNVTTSSSWSNVGVLPCNVRIGNTMEQVKAMCGDPAFVNKGQPPLGQPKETTTTEYNYNSNPPVTLIFVNGKLQARR